MPVYISELSPKNYRGALVSMVGIGYTSGSMVAQIMNIGFAELHWGWRLSFAVQGVFVLLYGFGMLFMPHSPRYAKYMFIFLIANHTLPKLSCHVIC